MTLSPGNTLIRSDSATGRITSYNVCYTKLLRPDTVRSVTLDSVVPMQLALGQEHALMLDRSVENVFTDCAADEACNSRFPEGFAELNRITSYNVCYTKLLRVWQPGACASTSGKKTITMRAMELIDIGCNLTHDSFDDDRDEVIESAFEAGVCQMIVTGASADGSRDALQLAREWP